MNLPIQQARGLFYKTYLRAYQETVPVSSFLRTFFNTSTTSAKTVAVEVQRGTEKIAIDVLRGVEGKRNTFSKSTEKEYLPPMFNENFDATSLDRYDRIFGGELSDVPPATIGYLANDVVTKIMMLRDKIERAKELQCAQVFETGVITLLNGDNIDFKRKAASLVDLGAAGYWSNDDAPVEAQLVAGSQFIRNKGKNGTPEFNLIMSGAAFIALKKTDYFTANANFQQVQLIDIKMPQTSSFGAGYHGKIIAGAYTYHVWTYDEVYETSAGVITKYLPDNTAFMVPVKGTRFELAHAGVPAIIRDVKNAEFPQFIASQAGEYYTNDYIDPAGKSHTFEILSAPVAVPVTVDMIYTLQVLT